MGFDVLTTALDALRTAAAGVPADRLDDPTPCAQWTVAQVLHHAAGDQHAWAATIGHGDLPVYNPFDPPRRLDQGAGTVVAAAVDSASQAWEKVDPAADAVPTPLPPTPTLPAPLAAGACALDAAVHAWDVALATGQPSPLTAALAAQLLPAARATAEPLRGFAYAPALATDGGDDPVAELLKYLGRDPEWTP